MFVTARSPSGRELSEAFAAASLPVTIDHDRLLVDGIAIELPVIERSHPHPGEIADLVESTSGPALLVADRISAAGREVLRAGGWSWLDRRGHLRVWVAGLRVDTSLEIDGDDARGSSSSPWTPVGLEVALHALCHPDEEVRARAVAATIGRSVGGTQEIVGRFAEHGLIGRSSRLPLLPDLFWETSARWPDDDWAAVPVDLMTLATALGPELLTRVDERAATLGGARITAAADLPARCYVSTRSALRRARALADPTAPTRTFVRLPPVRWIPLLDGFEPDAEHPWQVAHPMVCALRLARDPSRGREIVQDWGILGHPVGGRMSDAVVLTGRPDGTTARAVDVLSGLPAEFRLIGGLAVLCRVGVPHRATVDLDALARRLDLFDDAIRSVAVSSTGGGQYVMAGRLELDVIDVSPDDAETLTGQLLAHGGDVTDLEINTVGHTWAHDTATAVDITVLSEDTHELLTRATGRPVASSAGLIAMKATTVPLRASSRPEKRASDLYDLGRLIATTDGIRGLGGAPGLLRSTVGRHLEEWFVSPRGRDRTFRDVRRFDEAALDLDEVADIVVEAALTS